MLLHQDMHLITKGRKDFARFHTSSTERSRRTYKENEQPQASVSLASSPDTASVVPQPITIHLQFLDGNIKTIGKSLSLVSSFWGKETQDYFAESSASSRIGTPGGRKNTTLSLSPRRFVHEWNEGLGLERREKKA
jgi:hypothetical protein